eukprot:Gb_34817 [translate_table: standard]
MLRLSDFLQRTEPELHLGNSGAGIGGAFLIIVAAMAIYKKKKKMLPQIQLCLGKKPVNPKRNISKVEKFLKDFAYKMPIRYSYPQLKKMTNNFSDKLGEGGFGVVYRGKLPNGTVVAAKLLDQSRHSEMQFMNEVGTIGRIHHVHLVRLLGFCFEEFRSALIYEYMANGSLERFIFKGSREHRERSHSQDLSWEQLYAIALGAARGIAYLHHDCDKRIIHFDIKPHNILLDEEMSAKVSDFGLAKLCGKGDDHISMTGARGTPGYVAPEVWSRNFGPITEKSDVYSFGMLLLEIVGGRENIDLKASHSSQLYFPEWAFHLLERRELSRLRGGAIEAEEELKAMKLCNVGMWCIQHKSTDRPSMGRVVQMLEGNGDDIPRPPMPFNSSTAPEAPLLATTEESSSMN